MWIHGFIRWVTEQWFFIVQSDRKKKERPSESLFHTVRLHQSLKSLYRQNVRPAVVLFFFNLILGWFVIFLVWLNCYFASLVNCYFASLVNCYIVNLLVYLTVTLLIWYFVSLLICLLDQTVFVLSFKSPFFVTLFVALLFCRIVTLLVCSFVTLLDQTVFTVFWVSNHPCLLLMFSMLCSHFLYLTIIFTPAMQSSVLPLGPVSSTNRINHICCVSLCHRKPR